VFRSVTRGGKGAQLPGRQITMGAPNDCGVAKKSQQCQKCTFFNTVHLVQNVTTMYFLQYKKSQQCTFFNVYLLPKALRFAKLASCRGRHLNTFRPGRCCRIALLGNNSLSYWSTLLSFSLRHLGHLSRNSIKTRRNSIHQSTFSEIMTELP